MLKVYSSDRAAAGLVLAHGAGAGQLSGFMVAAARALADRGITTATFDFPYIAEGRKVPDKAPVLEAAWRAAIAAACAHDAFKGLRLFIGGKSMGGRIASHVAAQGVGGIAGLIYLGYPLHPPGRPGQLRDAHLPAIGEPMLFIQGTKDAFGTADEILALLPRLQRAELHPIVGGDHSFKVSGRGAPKPDAVMDGILDAAAAWIRARI